METRLMEDYAKKIPVITAFLLVAGFINTYSFYEHFQIEIFTFLSVSELVLSFLPLIVPLLFAFALILVNSILQEERLYDEKKTNPFLQDKDLSFWGPFKDLFNLAKNRFVTNESKRQTWFHYIQQILSRIILFSLFISSTGYYFYAFVKRLGFPSQSPVGFFFLSAIWLLILSFQVNIYLKKSRYAEVSRVLTIIVFSFGFLAMIYLYNSYKAFSILENRPKYEIELTLNNSIIESGSNIVFVGKTKDFYFLRDLKSKLNIIVNNDMVVKAKLSPVQKKNSP